MEIEQETSELSQSLLYLLSTIKKIDTDTKDRIKKIIQALKEIQDISRGDIDSVREKFDEFYKEISFIRSKLDEIKNQKVEDYTLTEKDKKEIAQSITVPVVEKVIEKVVEKTEVIKEQPVTITEVIENKDTAEDIRNKLELLTGDDRLDKSAIKGFDDAVNESVTRAPVVEALVRRLGSDRVALTDGADISVDTGSLLDADVITELTVTLGGNRNISNPTAIADKKMVIFRIKQNAGSNTVSWGSMYRFSGGTAPTLTTTAGKVDYVGFRYNGPDNKLDCLAFKDNF